MEHNINSPQRGINYTFGLLSLSLSLSVQPVQPVDYEEDETSGSEHDAYLERMKAEGDNYDSEDGTNSIVTIQNYWFLFQGDVSLFRGFRLCGQSKWER